MSAGKIPELSAATYSIWKSRLLSLLKGKGFPDDCLQKEGIDTMIAMQKSDPKTSFTINRCVALIHKQLDDKHFLLQEECRFPHLIIDVFDKLYQSDNSTRLISLFRELSQLRYSDGEDMHLFVLKFEHIYNQIAQYGALDKRFLAAIFLSTLPPSWEAFETTVQVNSKYRATDLK